MSAKNNGQSLVTLDIVKMMALEFELATTALADSLQHYHRCGELLNVQKKQLGHGLWLGWLERNEKALGFKRVTAFRLMDFATHYPNVSLTKHLPEQKALTLSRELWGNAKNGSKPKKTKTPTKSKSGKKKRSTIAPIAPEEGTPLSQHGVKIWNRERHNKMTKRIEMRFAEAKLFHRAVRCVNQLDWDKHDGQLAQMAYDQGYRDGASDMEKGSL